MHYSLASRHNFASLRSCDFYWDKRWQNNKRVYKEFLRCKRLSHLWTEAHSMHALFSACSLRDDNVITSKRKLKHANSILEPSEYFCQLSSKSVHTISSYTVSKLGGFLRHSVDFDAVRCLANTPDRLPWIWVTFSPSAQPNPNILNPTLCTKSNPTRHWLRHWQIGRELSWGARCKTGLG